MGGIGNASKEWETDFIVTRLFNRLRTPPLALRNVVHGGRRSLAAISGLAFSLTMVFLQLGFLEAVKITATNNFDQLDFDILMLSPRYEQFYAPGTFPRARLNLARSVATVVSAAPLSVTFNLWRCPAYPVQHEGPGPARRSSPSRDSSNAGCWERSRLDRSSDASCS